MNKLTRDSPRLKELSYVYLFQFKDVIKQETKYLYLGSRGPANICICHKCCKEYLKEGVSFDKLDEYKRRIEKATKESIVFFPFILEPDCIRGIITLAGFYRG